MSFAPHSYAERRRHTRTPLGLPVRVHFADHPLPLTVELRDLSRGGCYFTGAAAPPATDVAFGFVLSDRRVCVAKGRVLRVDAHGFAIRIQRCNRSFVAFVTELSQPAGPVHAT